VPVKIRRLSVPPALTPWVEQIFLFESASGLPMGLNSLLPHAGGKLIVPLRGSFVLRSARFTVPVYRTPLLAGVWTEPVFVDPLEPRLETLVVVLRPWGLAPLMGIRASELLNGVVPLDAVVPGLGSESPDRWFGSLLLRGQALPTQSSQNSLAQEAIRFIRGYPGSPRVDEIAARLGYSVRYVYALFLQEVGVSPKDFTQLVRFQRSYRAYTLGSKNASHDDPGYADQAHRIREFRRFTGGAPQSFLAQQSSFSRGFFSPGLAGRSVEPSKQLNAVSDTELAVNSIEVVLDGFGRDRKLVGDLFVGSPHDEAPHNFGLAGTES